MSRENEDPRRIGHQVVMRCRPGVLMGVNLMASDVAEVASHKESSSANEADPQKAIIASLSFGELLANASGRNIVQARLEALQAEVLRLAGARLSADVDCEWRRSLPPLLPLPPKRGRDHVEGDGHGVSRKRSKASCQDAVQAASLLLSLVSEGR